MKNISNFILVSFFFLMTACSQGQMKMPSGVNSKLATFIKKEKFLEDPKILYPGIGNPVLKPVLTDKINALAEDFERIAQKENVSDKDFQDAIKIGLERFSVIYLELDTENRERICSYVEELMDIVGLESSDGHLNNFLYGFQIK